MMNLQGLIIVLMTIYGWYFIHKITEVINIMYRINTNLCDIKWKVMKLNGEVTDERDTDDSRRISAIDEPCG